MAIAFVPKIGLRREIVQNFYNLAFIILINWDEAEDNVSFYVSYQYYNSWNYVACAINAKS